MKPIKLVKSHDLYLALGAIPRLRAKTTSRFLALKLQTLIFKKFDVCRKEYKGACKR